MIGYWDRNLRNRFCNLAYAQWFGRQPDAMPGTHLRDFIGEERYRINLPHIEAALVGEEQRFEVPAYTANGSLSWHGLVQYIPDFIDGQVQGVYIIVSDISAVKETEAAMRKNETLLRESQTAARIGSYINTLATGTIECTPVMDEIFGMTPDYPHTNQGWMDLITRTGGKPCRTRLPSRSVTKHHLLPNSRSSDRATAPSAGCTVWQKLHRTTKEMSSA